MGSFLEEALGGVPGRRAKRLLQLKLRRTALCVCCHSSIPLSHSGGGGASLQILDQQQHILFSIIAIYVIETLRWLSSASSNKLYINSLVFVTGNVADESCNVMMT